MNYISRKMELNLMLHTESATTILPFNYQYPVASWIYHTIHQGNSEFAGWLHEHGYSYGQRKFKLFTFSPFRFRQVKAQGDRLLGFGSTCGISIRFLLPEGVQPFVQGCFVNRQFSIGDGISKAHFQVQTVECMPVPEFSRTMRYHTFSPICVSRPPMIDGERYARYLPPGEPDYSQRLHENLMNKLKAAGIAEELSESPFDLKVLSEPKSKLIHIKADRETESKIRAYNFTFELTAHPLLHHVGYYAGFGEKNSMGMGMTGVEMK